jgi:hypothetical protein
MTKGVEDVEGETGGILGGCTLPGGCVHVLRSTLKALLVQGRGPPSYPDTSLKMGRVVG